METMSPDHLSYENKTSNFQYSQSAGDVLSDDEKDVFILLNHVTLSTLFCLFGIVGNTLNMCVFARQGLTKSMNASFFAMTVSDTSEIVFQIWQNFCLNPYAQQIDSIVDFAEIQYLAAGIPSLFFMRYTGWITAYITAERCLSIALPLKIKQILTTRRTVAILVFIYVFNMESLVPVYFSAYFVWKFIPAQNRTKLGLSFRSSKLEIGRFNSYFHTAMAMLTFALVVMFTGVLVLRLKQKSKWRRKSTSRAPQMDKMSSRERKTVVMVTVIAAVMIACYAPGILLTIVAFVDSDFRIAGRKTNIYQAAWSFAFLLHSVNASVSVLLYYKTSSKYRHTVQEMLPRCFAGEKKDVVAVSDLHSL